jgi:trans-aconitate methyltransferase
MPPLTPLCELAKKHETDKGGRHLRYGGGDCEGTHEYTPVYWSLYGRRCEVVKSVLEIGINRGCSLRMWEEFFPNARIVGFDIDPNCIINEGRIESYKVDQSNRDDVRSTVQSTMAFPFDLIVDDGSHVARDQLLAMAALLPFLAPKGFYVVEEPDDIDLLAAMVREDYDWTKVPTFGVGRSAKMEPLLVVRRSTK